MEKGIRICWHFCSVKNTEKTLHLVSCYYESNLKFRIAIYKVVSIFLVPRNRTCERQHWGRLRIPCELYILMCPLRTPVPGSMRWQMNGPQRQLCVATF